MVADLINAIKNYAVEQGYCPEGYKLQLDLLKRLGRLYEVEDFDLKKRQRLGLPPIDKTIPEVAKILEYTEIIKHVNSKPQAQPSTFQKSAGQITKTQNPKPNDPSSQEKMEKE